MSLVLVLGRIDYWLWQFKLWRKLRCFTPPDTAWKWRKWTFGFWTDPENWTRFGIDVGPLEICWRSPGYRQ